MEKVYKTYKDSGVDFINKIPIHWQTGKLNYFLEVKDGTHDSPSYVDENESSYPLVTSKDLVSGNLEFNKCKYIKKEDHFKIIKRSNVSKGDILMPMIGTVGSPVIVSTNREFSIKNVALFKTSNSSKINVSYLNYLITSDFVERQFDLNSNGGVQNFVSLSVLRKLIVFYLPVKEQTQIAAYLDYHTKLIDTLISKKETLIQKLQEQRQAIINEAVTKGLNKNVALKDSGIEYIGSIAENWSNKRIKHSCYVKGRIGWKGLKSDDYLEKGYSYLVTGTDFTGQIVDWNKCHFVNQERYEEDPFIQLEEGDLLITKDGTIGKTTLVKNLNKPACLNSGIFLVRSLNPELNINFLYWILNSNVFKQFIDLTSTGATIKHLYQNVFIEFTYALPPITEQIEIQKYLFEKFDEFESAINNVQTSIQKLKVYRQSLISEAVTGKIDVRDWKQPNN